MTEVPDGDATATLAERVRRVRERMVELDIDVLAVSVGPDLPWLTGYEAMPLERLTMLVLPADGAATLVVPGLEVPRVVERPALFELRGWEEVEDPVGIVARLVGTAPTVAVGDRTWSRFLLALQRQLPGRRWVPASAVTGPLRAVKDPAEVGALRRAASAADRVAEALVAGAIGIAGRTEAEVGRALADALVAEGHERVNFTIVASGPHGASPHHDPGARRIGPGDVVVCDFGGTLDGYCSDVTRTVTVGDPGPEPVAVHEVVARARDAAVAAVRAGVAAAGVDGAARAVITAAGYGPAFVHRTGHGIGREEHEDPYLVAGNAEVLVAGNAFSIEPGIYLPGRFGVRIEDIVVVTEAGPEVLNQASRHLAVLDA